MVLQGVQDGRPFTVVLAEVEAPSVPGDVDSLRFVCVDGRGRSRTDIPALLTLAGAGIPTGLGGTTLFLSLTSQ